MSKQFQNGNHRTEDPIAKVEELMGKDKYVEVVDCAALNVREYPNGPVVDVIYTGTRLKVSKTKSETTGWTCVIAPSTHKDAFAMSHFLKEV